MKQKHAFISIIIVLAAHSAYSADSCRTLFDRGGETGSKTGAKSDVTVHERMGLVEEYQLRKEQVATHLYLDSTSAPYAFFAFPSGNSGVALWFKSSGKSAHLETSRGPRVINGAHGLRGAEVDLKTGVARLDVTDSVLGSMRFIRDRELGIAIPPEVKSEKIALQDGVLLIERTSLNGLVEYRLELEPLGNTQILTDASGKFELVAANEVRFRMRAMSTEKPLTPLAPSDVFKPEALARMSPKQVEAFSFLMTKEKLMAGSPRYLSKFGRDSLVTLHVMMDAMKPEAVESLLKAMLSSSHPEKGIISHEQSEGDFASYERLKKHEKVEGVTTPIEDYKMIDADFMFTITMTEYLARYPERAGRFLEGSDSRGLSLRRLVKNNFRHTLRSAAAFAKNPDFKNLIRLHPGEPVGQWRDSENGLGGGVYPFDVNAALVPGAIAALRDLVARPGTEFYDPSKSAELARAFEVWSTKVVPLFEVRIAQKDAAKIGEEYLRSLGIDPRALAPAPREDIVFPGIALDDGGKPVPIMHSDDSMMMTFGSPSPDFLRGAARRINHSFPYGLSTPVGILVANPAFASRELQQKFDETKYHGRVSWTMQEHLLLFGMKRVLAQGQAKQAAPELQAARLRVEDVIAKKSALGGNEVFALKFEHGVFKAVPFAGDAKSNSNQLWSHLSLVEDHLDVDSHARAAGH